MNEIKKEIGKVNDDELEKELQQIESQRKEESKYYEDVKILKRKETNKRLKMINKDGK